jgi:hypothetical protein
MLLQTHYHIKVKQDAFFFFFYFLFFPNQYGKNGYMGTKNSKGVGTHTKLQCRK